MEADISILHKPGHFYFALTSVPTASRGIASDNAATREAATPSESHGTEPPVKVIRRAVL
jgi:hypothetical protein